jgi:hypothetical protein
MDLGFRIHYLLSSGKYMYSINLWVKLNNVFGAFVKHIKKGNKSEI